MTQLPNQADCLGPAEALLDQFALPLTNFVSRVASGALIDRTAPSVVILRHMRRDLARAKFLDEPLRIVALVGTKRALPFACPQTIHHAQRDLHGIRPSYASRINGDLTL